MSEDFFDGLPTFPEVRCDECQTAYVVNTPPEGGMINGMCPECGHVGFSTTFEAMHGVKEVAMWNLTTGRVIGEDE